MNLPDPQLLSDAQSFNVFSQLMAQATVKIMNPEDGAEVDYEGYKKYFKTNLPKLKIIIERLEADLG